MRVTTTVLEAVGCSHFDVSRERFDGGTFKIVQTSFTDITVQSEFECDITIQSESGGVVGVSELVGLNDWRLIWEAFNRLTKDV
jgi:hypothetical protein